MQFSLLKLWMRQGMMPIFASLLIALCLLPSTASAIVTPGEAPPVTVVSPYEADYGQTEAGPFPRSYLYDTLAGVKVRYWGMVVDQLTQRLNPHIDAGTDLNNADKMWNLIEEHRLGQALTPPEAQILCLYMDSEDDAPPEDLIPNFPTWPGCGGVLEDMFGPRVLEYWHENQDTENPRNKARMAIFVNLLSHIGLSFDVINGTVSEQMRQTEPPLIGQEDQFGAGFVEDNTNRVCYRPTNNIRPYVMDDEAGADPDAGIQGCGILCSVTRVITGLLDAASRAIFESFFTNPVFQSVVVSAFLLYTVIYGAMVVLGFVPVVLGDALRRIVKLGIVVMLLTNGFALSIFDLFRCFFIEGTTWLINQVTLIGLHAVEAMGVEDDRLRTTITQVTNYGGTNICASSADPDGQGPLIVLERLITQIFSPHMFLVIITLFLSSLKGFILVIFLLLGLAFFLMALLSAVTIYLTALIAQYLLLSLLPIFLCFILFEQTKELFRGWVNQLVTYSLTPIFLFAYISLFVLVVEAAVAPMLDVEICWDKWFSVAWVFDLNKYHFTTPAGVTLEEPPFGFFEIFIFILFVYLMKEFEKNVEDLAREIGGSYVYVDKAASALRDWFKGKKDDMKKKLGDQFKSMPNRAQSVASKATTNKRPNVPDLPKPPPRKAPQVPAPPPPSGGGSGSGGTKRPGGPTLPKPPKPPGGTGGA